MQDNDLLQKKSIQEQREAQGKVSLERLRAVPILALLQVKATNRRLSVRCPFHSERTPSCVIYPDNSFHCFGCSKNGHGAIDFITALGFSFKEACEELEKYVQT